MPVELAADKFLNLLQRSGIVPEDRLQALIEEFSRPDSPFDSAQKIADELVRREVLTGWQASMLLQGKHRGFILGPYRILKPLGRGGMGAVYLAEHQMMRRRCAIKVLPSNYDRQSSVLDRFYREAQAVAALDHPNIVRAYDVNKCVQNKTEIHYLVMEYIEGRDLQKMVEEDGVLGYRQAAEYIRQAAEGLAHAHEAGFVHRDIKPANLVVDTKGVVKILDLGLARVFEEAAEGSLTKELGETVLGTADYLAPEQALDSHEIDARADIYSLGQTFYFLLTGHPPFPEGTVAQRLLAHQMKQPEPITVTRPDAPPSLLAIINKMTAKDPNQRFQSAAEVAQTLKAWLEGHVSDSGFLSQVASSGITPAVSGAAAPTHPKALDETELELAPIEEEQEPKPSSSTRLVGPPGGSGTDTAAAEKKPSLSDSQVPVVRVEPPADETDEYRIAGEPEGLEPIKEPSLESALEADLPPAEQALPRTPAAGSGAMRTVGPPTPKPAKTMPVRKVRQPPKPAAAEEKSLFGELFQSPWLWIGLAVLVVVGVVMAILLSRPTPEEVVSPGGTPPSMAAAGSAGSEIEQQPQGAAGEPKDRAQRAGQRREERATPDEQRSAEGAGQPPRGPKEPKQSPASASQPPGEGERQPDQSPAAAGIGQRGRGKQGRRPRHQQDRGGPQPPSGGQPAPAAEVAQSGRPSRYGPRPQTQQTTPTEVTAQRPVLAPAQSTEAEQFGPSSAALDAEVLFGRISSMAIRLESKDKKDKGTELPWNKAGPLTSMLAYEFNHRLKVLGLKADDDSPAVLRLWIQVDRQGPRMTWTLCGELQYVAESQEITLWQDKQVLLRNALRPNQQLVRREVQAFFDRLADHYKAAKKKAGQEQ